jgi:phosphohistidine phosphatase SixA
MGMLLKDGDLIPDHIVSSTVVRVKRTAELVAKGCKHEGAIVLNCLLYEAESKGYIRP